MGLKTLCPIVPQNSVRDAKCPGFFELVLVPLDRGACIRRFEDLLTHICAICIYIHVICLPKIQSLASVTVECGVKSRKYINSIKNKKMYHASYYKYLA